jgi:hypothetical protein
MHREDLPTRWWVRCRTRGGGYETPTRESGRPREFRSFAPSSAPRREGASAAFGPGAEVLPAGSARPLTLLPFRVRHNPMPREGLRWCAWTTTRFGRCSLAWRELIQPAAPASNGPRSWPQVPTPRRSWRGSSPTVGNPRLRRRHRRDTAYTDRAFTPAAGRSRGFRLASCSPPARSTDPALPTPRDRDQFRWRVAWLSGGPSSRTRRPCSAG